MNKTWIFILSVFMAVGFAFPFVPTAEAQTEGMTTMRKKRYRYRKRTHRVQLGGSVTPWAGSKLSHRKFAYQFAGLYGYNLGYFEVGPNVRLGSEGGSGADWRLETGVWADVNILKNTRKQKVVPAIGVRVNYLKGTQSSTGDHKFLIGPQVSLKMFPASRTGIVFDIGFDYVTPFKRFFREHGYGLNVNVAFVHYFH